MSKYIFILSLFTGNGSPSNIRYIPPSRIPRTWGHYGLVDEANCTPAGGWGLIPNAGRIKIVVGHTTNSEIVHLTLKFQIHATHKSNKYIFPIEVWETHIKKKRIVTSTTQCLDYISKLNYNKSILYTQINLRDLSNYVMSL